MDIEKQDNTKRICNILFGPSDAPEVAYKDCGMFLYTLAKYLGQDITNLDIEKERAKILKEIIILRS